MGSANATSGVWGLPSAFLPALKNFGYQPVTDWQGWCQGWFSPHITFGSNIEDRSIETHVLDAVGSYGSQINRIMDAVSVLASRLDPQGLTPNEQLTVAKFNELASLADKAASDFQDKARPEDITDAGVSRWLDAIEDLKIARPAAYARIASRILTSLS